MEGFLRRRRTLKEMGILYWTNKLEFEQIKAAKTVCVEYPYTLNRKRQQEMLNSLWSTHKGP